MHEPKRLIHNQPDGTDQKNARENLISLQEALRFDDRIPQTGVYGDELG